jgi:hypothetical protein
MFTFNTKHGDEPTNTALRQFLSPAAGSCREPILHSVLFFLKSEINANDIWKTELQHWIQRYGRNSIEYG